jgi:hypothetical protein
MNDSQCIGGEMFGSEQTAYFQMEQACMNLTAALKMRPTFLSDLMYDYRV